MSENKLKITVIPGGNQMSLIRDTEEVVKFLEFAARKAILDEHSVQCRLSACHNIFAFVEEQEDNVDYMLKNLHVFIHRFRVKNKVTNDATIRSYKSRVKSSLEYFRAWSADPYGWEKSLAEGKPEKPAVKKTHVVKRASKRKPEVKVKADVKVNPIEPREITVPATGMRIALPIRPNFSAEVLLPEDGLTKQEFRRIGAFLFPYCRDVEFGEQVWSKLTQ